MKVSVVIPTRNRHESLRRLLGALQSQTLTPSETIIVDSSDDDDSTDLPRNFPDLHLKVVRSSPSVCVQRNIGIRHSSAGLIFLCDDDMEPERDYIRSIAEYLVGHPERTVATGYVCERGADGGFRDLPEISFRRLVWNSIFQLSVWTDLGTVRAPAGTGGMMRLLRRRFERKGNTLTSAGWPLVTQNHGAVFNAAVFGLGACIVRRESLADNPFDELLDGKGIGDNYGLALGLGEGKPISVLTGVRVLHHRESGNVLPDPETYARRVMSMDYMLVTKRGGQTRHRHALMWSLLGSCIAFAAHGRWQLVLTSLHLQRLLLSGRNPYIRSFQTGGVTPPAETLLPQIILHQYNEGIRNAR